MQLERGFSENLEESKRSEMTDKMLERRAECCSCILHIHDVVTCVGRDYVVTVDTFVHEW